MTGISAFLDSQPMFTGLVGATLAGGLLFMLRAAPAAIWKRIADMLSVTLVIEQREVAFKFIDEWLAKSQAVPRARRLMVNESYDYDEGRWQWTMTLGRGWHVMRYQGALLLINREVQDGGDLSMAVGRGPQQRFWVRSLGRSQKALRALIGEAKASYFGDGLLKVFVWNSGDWICVDRRRPRRLETVFMPAAQKQRVMDDMNRFLAAREWYAQRGVPWRRGYLFQGPPGTGKTTLIAACAGALGRSICALNLNNVQNDNQLIEAFNQAPHNSVVVIEDIDTATIAHDRAEKQAAASALAAAGAAAKEEPAKGVTLSGLLNAIDGLAAREGRILFVTTNHPEKLDPALMRPGRIDRVEEIGPLNRQEAEDMAAAFGKGPDALDGIILPAPAATLQERFLSGGPDPSGAGERAA